MAKPPKDRNRRAPGGAPRKPRSDADRPARGPRPSAKGAYSKDSAKGARPRDDERAPPRRGGYPKPRPTEGEEAARPDQRPKPFGARRSAEQRGRPGEKTWERREGAPAPRPHRSERRNQTATDDATGRGRFRADSERHKPDGDRPRRDADRPSGPKQRRHSAPPRAVEEARPAPRKIDPSQLWIYGRHAVTAALLNPARPVWRLLVTESGADWLATQSVPAEKLAKLERVEPYELDAALMPGAVHQGLAVMVGDLPRARLHETCAVDERRRTVVVLDQITDPQNIGAIFRTAAAFDAVAVIVQERRTPPLAGALAKAAAGAVELIPCIKVVNVARALEGLKGLGYFCAGLTGDSESDIGQIPNDRPIALVIGAEGDGMRKLVRETCDGLYRIPISPAVESLNVSTAAAVSLFAITKARSNE